MTDKKKPAPVTPAPASPQENAKIIRDRQERMKDRALFSDRPSNPYVKK